MSSLDTNQTIRSSCYKDCATRWKLSLPSTPTTLSTQSPWGSRNFLWPRVIAFWSTNSMVGIFVGSVVITQYAGQTAADAFHKQLDKSGIASYLHYPIKGYPTDMDTSSLLKGWGKTTTSKLVAIWSLWQLLALVLVSWQLVCPICTMTN